MSVRITNQDPRKNSDSVAYHREVYDAIAAKDGDLAKKLLNDALRRLKESFGDDLLMN